MPKDLESIMQDLPKERRAKIEKRARELIYEQVTLQDINNVQDSLEERKQKS